MKLTQYPKHQPVASVNYKMKSQKKMWQEINEPKTEELITAFDENGELWLVAEIVDRIPRIRRNRNARKKQ